MLVFERASTEQQHQSDQPQQRETTPEPENRKRKASEASNPVPEGSGKRSLTSRAEAAKQFFTSSKGKQRASSSKDKAEASLSKEVEASDKKNWDKNVRRIVGLRYCWQCIITGEVICIEIAHLLSYTSTKSNELLAYMHGNWGMIEHMFPNVPICGRLRDYTNERGGLDQTANLLVLCSNCHDLLDRSVLGLKPRGEATSHPDGVEVIVIEHDNVKIDRVKKGHFDEEDLDLLCNDVGPAYPSNINGLSVIDGRMYRRVQPGTIILIRWGKEDRQMLHDMLTVRNALDEIRSLAGAVDLNPLRKHDDDEDNAGVEGVKAKDASPANS